jgi:hypothetical protein
VTSNGVTVRTSLSHPLRIDELRIDGVTGLIGITFCPGKRGESYGGFRWERDLEKDLNVIADWRADAVVTLIEDHEFEMLGVPQLGEQVRARGIEWHHLPIKDVAPPDARFEEGWVTSGPQLSVHPCTGRESTGALSRWTRTRRDRGRSFIGRVRCSCQRRQSHGYAVRVPGPSRHSNKCNMSSTCQAEEIAKQENYLELV